VWGRDAARETRVRRKGIGVKYVGGRLCDDSLRVRKLGPLFQKESQGTGEVVEPERAPDVRIPASKHEPARSIKILCLPQANDASWRHRRREKSPSDARCRVADDGIREQPRLIRLFASWSAPGPAEARTSDLLDGREPFDDRLGAPGGLARQGLPAWSRVAQTARLEPSGQAFGEMASKTRAIA
jgi:hypothetical protein